MQKTFKYFCFVAIIRSVFCEFAFDTNGGVVVVDGTSGKLRNYPELLGSSRQKLDEAFETYLVDREDPAKSESRFFVKAEGYSFSFRVRLDNNQGSAGNFHLIHLAGNEEKPWGYDIHTSIRGFTYKSTSLKEVNAQLQKLGDKTPEEPLEIGINFICNSLFFLPVRQFIMPYRLYQLVDKSTPMGFRARLIKGTDTMKGKTGVYLFLGVFISKELSLQKL